MIAILDYGAGNLGSVHKAFRYLGAPVEVTADPDLVERADAVVLPGVGAFSACMRGLDRVGLPRPVKQFIATGRPFLGICVGLQMLFDASDEMGDSAGLGVLPGRVVRFDFSPEQRQQERLKVPHIGWNSLDVSPDATLFQGVGNGEQVYFVHSFYPKPEDPSVISARSNYGGAFCAAVQHGNIHATQFHPEKSGAVGIEILRNFTTSVS